MSTNKKPRKKHRENNLGHCLPIVFAIPKEQRTELDLMPFGALTAFANGAGTEDAAYTMINACNLGSLLAENHTQEARDCIRAGQVAIISVMQRGEAGKWGFSGSEYQALKAAISLCDEMMQLATRRELKESLEKLYEAVA